MQWHLYVLHCTAVNGAVYIQDRARLIPDGASGLSSVTSLRIVTASERQLIGQGIHKLENMFGLRRAAAGVRADLQATKLAFVPLVSTVYGGNTS